MSIQPIHQEALQQFIDEAIRDTDLFLIDLKILPYAKIEVFLDGDDGVTIQKCAQVARYINKNLEEKFGEDFIYELEVSSAGLEHPLKLVRQYLKNIGRKLEITLSDDSTLEGKLEAANETEFTLTYSLPKAKHKKETKTIPYTAVKTAFVGVSF